MDEVLNEGLRAGTGLAASCWPLRILPPASKMTPTFPHFTSSEDRALSAELVAGA